MAKSNNKCSCCGYKFKRNDGEICPECLTSRENTLDCSGLSDDLHSHEQGFSFGREEMTEMEKQLESERLQSAMIKNNLNGTTRTGNRATTFKSSAVRKTSGTTQSFQNKVSTTSQGQYTTTFTTNNNKGKKKNSLAVKIVIIVIVAYIIINFLVPVIGAVIFSFAKNSFDDKRNDISDNLQSYEINYNDYPEFEFETTYAPTTVNQDGTASGFNTFGTELTISKPYFNSMEPKFFDSDYVDYVDCEDYESCKLLTVPITIYNDTDETININDFYFEIESYYGDEIYVSRPLDRGDSFYLNSDTTFSYAVYFAVPKADAYEIIDKSDDSSLLHRTARYSAYSLGNPW